MNTKQSTDWGVSIYESWCSEGQVEKDILQISCTELDDYIIHFVQETVQKDGKEPYSSCLFSVICRRMLYLLIQLSIFSYSSSAV